MNLAHHKNAPLGYFNKEIVQSEFIPNTSFKELTYAFKWIEWMESRIPKFRRFSTEN